MLVGIEGGGTKWVIATSGSSDGVRLLATIPTGDPEETLAQAIEVLRRDGREAIEGVGIGCFGPLDLDERSPSYGQILRTPKEGWSNVDVVGPFAQAFDVAVALETDVTAAALGEQRLGAARDVENMLYVTVGTGIGGGILADRRPLRGATHPDFGHIRVPHDWNEDPFPGVCPFHGDCLEGLASGPALLMRWGKPAESLESDDVWDLEARYLALGLANATLMLSPQRVVLGGGVAKRAGLIAKVRAHLERTLAGYVDVTRLFGGIERYVVPAALGDRAGVVGALELARTACEEAPSIAVGS
jgi:fructokinase